MEYELNIKQPFINLKIKNDAEKIACELFLDAKLERYFNFEAGLSDDYDFIAYYDVSNFIGKTILIKIDKTISSPIEELFIQSKSPMGMDNLYHEKYRPQFHFSSKRGWINDPNGLIYYEGQYHLFYQHNPFGLKNDNMHWGHAVSKDMFHWHELQDALYPDIFGTIYSGSAVIDHYNTSGLGINGKTPMILLYTAAKRLPQKDYTQCLAYSSDAGETFEKYASNPILPQVVEENRDPHVLWHEKSHQWIKTLYLTKVNAVIHEFAIYGSKDLKNWRELDCFQFPGFECPGFCEFSVCNEQGIKKWVFWGAEGCYLVGNFDGKKFIPTQGTLFDGTAQLDQYGSAYAGQIFSNMPNGRIVKISWMRWMQNGNLAKMPFSQFMTLPVELSLFTTDIGYQLKYEPVKEIENLYSDIVKLERVSAVEVERAMLEIESDLFDMHLEITTDNDFVSFNVKGIKITWDPKTCYLKCLSRRAYVPEKTGKLKLRLIADKTSLEIFANDGLVYLPIGTPLNTGGSPIIFDYAENLDDINFSFYSMKPIWE